MEENNKQSSSGLEFKLHPLVLINISDHHTRIKANTPDLIPPRVLGCLLGVQTGRSIDISNSFELKHHQSAEGTVIDQVFLVRKQEQYKQVFPKLDVVGWYGTGSELTDDDMQIHKKMTELNESPTFLLLNPKMEFARKDLPLTLYETELHVLDGVPSNIFVKANYVIETSDAERIGVDQVAKILPSGKASGSEQLSAHLNGMHQAIKMLHSRLRVLHEALEQIARGDIPFNHSLLRQVSSLVHSLPAIDHAQFQQDYLTEYNDTLLTIHLSSITKGIYSANELVDKFMLAYDKSAARRRGGML